MIFIKDTNGKIKPKNFVEYYGMILVPTLKPGAHSAAPLTAVAGTNQTSFLSIYLCL